MIIYIAGPMTGLPEFNYPAFHAAAGRLHAAGFEVLNPIDTDHDPDNIHPWDWYLRRALRMVLDAGCVATLPGWEASRGATLEVHVASSLDMPAKPLEEWLK